MLVATNNGMTTGTVVGSWANANGTPRPIGQQMSVDPSIAASFAGSANSYVVLGEVQYPFQPTGIYYTIGAVTLHDSDYDDPPNGRRDHRSMTRGVPAPERRCRTRSRPLRQRGIR